MVGCNRPEKSFRVILPVGYKKTSYLLQSEQLICKTLVAKASGSFMQRAIAK